MAATAGQIPSPAQPRQLGLDPGRPGLELQGELFVVPTPGPPTRPSRALAAGTTSAPEDPEDAPPANEALAAEAQRRPRQRQRRTRRRRFFLRRLGQKHSSRSGTAPARSTTIRPICPAGTTTAWWMPPCCPRCCATTWS